MPDFIQVPLQRLDPAPDAGCHISVEATINGQAVNLLIDTGASATLLAKDRLLPLLGEAAFEVNNEGYSVVANAGRMETYSVDVDVLRIGDLELRDLVLSALDLTDLNAQMHQHHLPPVEGIVGGDLLLQLRAVIDYRLMALRMEGLGV